MPSLGRGSCRALSRPPVSHCPPFAIAVCGRSTRCKPHEPDQPSRERHAQPLEGCRRPRRGFALRRQGHRRGCRASHLLDAAARMRPAAGFARRRQHLGQDRGPGRPWGAARRAVRQGLGLGHGDDRAGRTAGGQARAAAPAACARQARRRGHGQLSACQPDRCDGAQPFGRNAAARVPAAQVHRSHARCRRPQSGRPAGQRGSYRRSVRR